MNLDFKDVIAVDTETTPDGKLLCISACGDHGSHVNWKWNSAHKIPSKTHLVFHNAKFDLKVLKAHGITLPNPIHDTMLMAKVCYEHLPSYSLKNLGYYYLGEFHMEQLALEDWFLRNGYKRNDDMSLLPKELLEAYTLKDVEITLQLFWLFYEILHDRNLWGSYEIERNLVYSLIRMEENGILIDRKWVKNYDLTLCEKRKKLISKAKKIVGDPDFNPQSIPQTARYLALQNISLPRTAKGNPKLDKVTRSNLSHPLLTVQSELAEANKISRTYCGNLLKATESNTLVHPNFMQSFAATRRFSSKGVGEVKLNWQNFPEEVRRAVIIPKGEIGYWFDYKQIENVIHIYFSEDRVRRKAYEADEEWSEYLWLAEKILKRKISKEDPEYKRIKSTKLGMNYGMGMNKFAKQNGLSQEVAQQLFTQVSEACPAIRQLQRKVERLLIKNGFVRDPFGYVYHGPPRKAYKVVAYMIQGCAAALMKQAILRVSKIPEVKIRSTVHDELFVTMKNTSRHEILAKLIKKNMTDFSQFDNIPIRVEAYRSTKSWGEKEKINLT